MTQTKQWILNAYPTALPTLEGSNPTFKVAETTLPDLQDGQVLLKVLYFSNDPAQRGWISYYEDESRLYVPPVHTGDLMRSRAIAEVVESKDGKVKKGDIVSANTGWSQYSVQNAKDVNAVQPLPNNLPLTHYLGALGSTGLTAYHGLVDVARGSKDDVVVVSGAAGATGSMVVQIAKKIIGCKKVIGIAGGAEKCAWVKKLGADECLDYKAADFKERLVEATPDFANVFFDNVGGEILDLMLSRMALRGRIAVCGAISAYNAAGDEARAKLTWFHVISMRLEIRGFIVLDYAAHFGETLQKLRKALEEGKLDISEGEHVVESKFEDVPATWLKLFEGANTGKLITKLL